MINSVEVIEDQNLLSLGKLTKVDKSKIQMVSSGEDKSKVEGFLSRRGSEMALKHLCEKFGSSLFDKLPKMWDCLTEVLKPIPRDDEQILHMTNPYMDNDPQALINNIQVSTLFYIYICYEINCLFHCMLNLLQLMHESHDATTAMKL